MSGIDLLVLRIERRTISIACFSGIRLDYTQGRELSSDRDTALRTAEYFITWAYETFQPEVVALEDVVVRPGSRRDSLHYVIHRRLRFLVSTRTKVDLAEIRQSFGVPTPTSRAEIRRIVRALWPNLPARVSGPGVLDAAALGLSLQMRAALNS